MKYHTVSSKSHRNWFYLILFLFIVNVTFGVILNNFLVWVGVIGIVILLTSNYFINKRNSS